MCLLTSDLRDVPLFDSTNPKDVLFFHDTTTTYVARMVMEMARGEEVRQQEKKELTKVVCRFFLFIYLFISLIFFSFFFVYIFLFPSSSGDFFEA